jgi:hypothetical protein
MAWRAYAHGRPARLGRKRANWTPRQAAIAAGETRYQGRPCSRCGGTERRTTSGGCVACRRVKNLAPKQIDRKRARNRSANMTEEQAERKRARGRERYRNLSGLEPRSP